MKNGKLITDRLALLTLLVLLLALPLLSQAESYTYDNAGRLTGVIYDDGSRITYSYDNAGNRTQQQAAANNSPGTFTLVYPADGQTGVSASPTLIWNQAVDPDGDPVSYQFTLCQDATFTGCTPQTVALNTTQNTTLYAQVGGSLAGVFLLGMLFPAGTYARNKTKIRKMLMLLALLTLVAGITSCGGGGGSSSPGTPGPPTPGAGEVGTSAPGLTAATTYYWKITAIDNYGGSTDSATRSFTTQ